MCQKNGESWQERNSSKRGTHNRGDNCKTCYILCIQAQTYILYAVSYIYIHSSSFFQKPSTGLGLLLVLVHWSVFPLKSLYLGKPCLEREATKASVREIQYRLLREVLNPVSICQRLFLSRSKGLNR